MLTNNIFCKKMQKSISLPLSCMFRRLSRSVTLLMLFTFFWSISKLFSFRELMVHQYQSWPHSASYFENWTRFTAKISTFIRCSKYVWENDLALFKITFTLTFHSYFSHILLIDAFKIMLQFLFRALEGSKIPLTVCDLLIGNDRHG